MSQGVCCTLFSSLLRSFLKSASRSSFPAAAIAAAPAAAARPEPALWPPGVSWCCAKGAHKFLAACALKALIRPRGCSTSPCSLQGPRAVEHVQPYQMLLSLRAFGRAARALIIRLLHSKSSLGMSVSPL